MTFKDFHSRFQSVFRKEDFINYGIKPSKFVTYGDTQEIIGFDRLEEGCNIWIKGVRFPKTRHTLSERVGVLAQFKKMVPLFFRFVSGREEFEEMGIFQKLIIVVGATQYWKYFVECLHWALGDLYREPRFYSHSTRELYRALSGINPFWDKIRDIACVFWEYDSAYGFRGQDMCGELSKENFSQHPLREMKRLMRIGMSREVKDGEFTEHNFMFGKWMAIELLCWYLFFHRKLLKQLKDIVQNINLEEMKLTKAELYWANTNPSYDFRGVSYKRRLAQNKQLNQNHESNTNS